MLTGGLRIISCDFFTLCIIRFQGLCFVGIWFGVFKNDIIMINNKSAANGRKTCAISYRTNHFSSLGITIILTIDEKR